MGDVVDFQDRRGSRAEAAAERQIVATQSREEKAERAAELRTRLKANRPLSVGDQTTVAHGVWRLLDQLQRSGAASKAQVLRAAGIGSEGDSTKHLGQYALVPARPDAGAGRLNKRPRKYVDILDKAAELAAMDKDAVLLDVFSATSLAAPGVAQIAEPEFEEMAGRLRAIGDAIAANYDLQTYFKRALRSGMGLVVTNTDDDTKEQPLGPDEIELALDNGLFSLNWPIEFGKPCEDFKRNELEEQVPLYPSLVLGKWYVGDECGFRYDLIVHDEDGCPLLAGAVAPDTAKLHGQHWAELRLCIVPSGLDLHPRPALRVAVGVHCFRPCPGPPNYELLEPGLDIKGWLPSSLPCAVTGTDEKDYMLWKDGPESPEPIGKYFPRSGRLADLGCTFLPVTGTVAQDWFKLDLSEVSEFLHEKPPHVRALGESLLRCAFANYFSPFAPNTIAAALDHCLSGIGQGDPLNLLDEQAGRLVGLLNTAEAADRARRAKALNKLDNRLRHMASRNSNSV